MPQRGVEAKLGGKLESLVIPKTNGHTQSSQRWPIRWLMRAVPGGRALQKTKHPPSHWNQPDGNRTSWCTKSRWTCWL